VRCTPNWRTRRDETANSAVEMADSRVRVGDRAIPHPGAIGENPITLRYRRFGHAQKSTM
jgi:hypothetical protein